MKPIRITIDGTAGAGKSTLGECLAQQFGYLYIDTGAMYRALTWLALSQKVGIHNGAALAHMAAQTSIVITRPESNDGRQYTVLVNGYDATWDIRETTVTHSVASVSSHPEVRTLLIKQQRTLAQAGGVVMVGRDIGTVVLPDAELKIFLNARPETRARRRYLELLKQHGKNSSPAISMEEVLREMIRRDEMDRANTRPAKDALMITTDDLDAAQVVELVCQKLSKQIPLLSLYGR